MRFRRSPEGRRGGLALVVLMLLAGFSLVASWQFALLAAKGRLVAVERSRALAAADGRVLARLAQDALLACGSERGGMDSSLLEARLRERLELLGGDGAVPEFRVVAIEGNPVRSGPSAQGRGQPALAGLEAEAHALMQAEGIPAAGCTGVLGTISVTFALPHAWSGRELRSATRLLAADCTPAGYPYFGYTLPADAGAPGAYGSSFPLPTGRPPSPDAPRSVRSPSVARNRLELGTMFAARLFSPSGAQLQVDLAGPTHVLDLAEGGDAAPVSQPTMEGVEWTGWREVRIDLSRVGIGTRLLPSGMVSMPGNRIVVDGSGGGRVRLRACGGADEPALHFSLLGPPDGSGRTLEVLFEGGIGRPTVIQAWNARLTTGTAPAPCNAALFLDRDCTASLMGALKVVHLTAHAGSIDRLRSAGIEASGGASASLAAAAPSTPLVFVRRTRDPIP